MHGFLRCKNLQSIRGELSIRIGVPFPGRVPGGIAFDSSDGNSRQQRTSLGDPGSSDDSVLVVPSGILPYAMSTRKCIFLNSRAIREHRTLVSFVGERSANRRTVRSPCAIDNYWVTGQRKIPDGFIVRGSAGSTECEIMSLRVPGAAIRRRSRVSARSGPRPGPGSRDPRDAKPSPPGGKTAAKGVSRWNRATLSRSLGVVFLSSRNWIRNLIGNPRQLAPAQKLLRSGVRG